MTLQDQCREFKVKLNEIANDLGYTRQYVYMVVGGKRQNHKITSAVYLALEKRKSELRKLIG